MWFERVIRAGDAFWEPGGDIIRYHDGNTVPDVWSRFADAPTEADVLRDEADRYVARLRVPGAASTALRYDGIGHDFMMLTPLNNTEPTRAVFARAIAFLPEALHCL
jgi:acetyl esterase/lipase